MNTQPEEIAKQKLQMAIGYIKGYMAGSHPDYAVDAIKILESLCVSEPVAPIDKTLSAEGNYLSPESFLHESNEGADIKLKPSEWVQLHKWMTDFANLRVEQAKEEWFTKEEFKTIGVDILHIYNHVSLNEIEVHKRNLILNKIKKILGEDYGK